MINLDFKSDIFKIGNYINILIAIINYNLFFFEIIINIKVECE